MRFHILTLGCPKNTVDSEELEAQLLAQGHRSVARPSRADLVIVNTCGFIRDAEEESLAALRELARRKRPGQALVAIGCLSERYGDALRRAVRGLDLVLGTYQGPALLRWVSARVPKTRPLARRPRRVSRPSAYLKIADGCDAQCAFCIIPQLKGRYGSVPLPQVVERARRLAAEGVKELVLVAQDTTAYGHDRGEREGLSRLIAALVEAVPQVPWIRIMYAHPANLTQRLAEVMEAYPQVVPYLDLPLQHAHPDVLRRMGRPTDGAGLGRLLEQLRRYVPGIALRTSFIVGYPGETEAEFRTLLDFVEETGFDRVGVFVYSCEEGTQAAALPDQIPDEVKEARRERLLEVQRNVSLSLNQRLVGWEIDVLIESVSPMRLGHEDSYVIGRSFRDAPEVDGVVFVAGEAGPGEMVHCRVTAAMDYDLMAEPV